MVTSTNYEFSNIFFFLDPMDPNSTITYTNDWVVQLQNCVFMSIILSANNTKLEQYPPEHCEEWLWSFKSAVSLINH